MVFHVKQTPYGMDEFLRGTGVSRETAERVKLYAEMLEKWQARINLVGPETIPSLWSRHFLDSAQVFPLVPKSIHRLVDMGSGAGFPGLMLALLGGPDVHLIESDSRKCAFLREAARVTGTAVTIHNARIEQVAPLGADLVTARALAPLEKLLSWAERHLAEGGSCLFLKGKGAEDELTQAAKGWIFTHDRITSRTDPAGSILHLREVRRGRAER